MHWWFDPNSSPGWIDYFGVVLAVTGFVVAIVQLTKTRAAAIAAVDGLRAAQRDLVTNQALGLASEFASIHSDLHTAGSAQNLELAHAALLRYSRVAGQAAEVISGLSPQDQVEADVLVADLKATPERVLDIKAELFIPRRLSDPLDLFVALMSTTNGLETQMAALARFTQRLSNQLRTEVSNVHNR